MPKAKLTEKEKAANAAKRKQEAAERKNWSPEKKAQFKRQNFIRLANARVPKAVKAINQIGNLAGSQYSHTEKDISLLEKTLNDAVTGVVQRFRGTVKAEPTIRFGD